MIEGYSVIRDEPASFEFPQYEQGVETSFIDHDMCIRVWLEVGHVIEPRSRSALGRSLSLDWRVWVRGPRGADISAFVHKVVFYLNPPSAFCYPKRVIQEPPYEIQETGSSSIEIPIHVYLKHATQPKIKLRYSLQIENLLECCSEASSVYHDVINPSETLRNLLMKGGGELLPHTKNPKETVRDLDKPLKKRQRPDECKKLHKKIIKPYSFDGKTKNFDPTNLDFTNLLKSVNMSKSEIDVVSNLYLSYNAYEKSVNALSLPSISDPIYKVPELPASLKGYLTSVESEYSRQ